MSFKLCQVTECSDSASQSLTVEGTNLSKLVCARPVHVRWAKDQLSQDRPGAVIEAAVLMQHTAPEECL